MTSKLFVIHDDPFVPKKEKEKKLALANCELLIERVKNIYRDIYTDLY